jgi:5'-nucleotidase
LRRILVTNDDGIESPGLIALAEELTALGAVTVVAPDGDRSGVAHAISIKHPVRVVAVPSRATPSYACSGTPADCVVVGAFDLCGGLPDVVVSGINRGPNLGDDINYSGTVAAAIEGVIVGVRSIAVSLAAAWPDFSETHHWRSAAVAAARAVRALWSGDFPERTLVNLNVPNLPLAQIKGTRVTVQGRKRYENRLDRRTDPRGEAYYWIWGRFDPAQIGSGTDLEAIRDGYVSLMPLAFDRTDAALVEQWRERAELAAFGPAITEA